MGARPVLSWEHQPPLAQFTLAVSDIAAVPLLMPAATFSQLLPLIPKESICGIGFPWRRPRRRPADDHASPSVSCANTSSQEPSECSAIPIEKYAITRAGNDRFRCSLLPATSIT